MKNTKKNVTKMSKFEATMIACQRAKAQALKESGAKKISKPKANKKSVNESKKVARKVQNKKVENAVRRRRMVEDEDYDPEVDDVDLPDDTASDAVIVIDPELDTDEYEANLDDLQAIIDETPDGEVPSTEEYVNDFVYTCPICGNNFFSDVEMGDGEECPVCGEEVDEFILVGGVELPDEALGDEGDEDFTDDEIVDDTSDEDIEDEPVEEESLEVDADTEECECDECLIKDADVTDEGDPLESKKIRRGSAKKESYKYMIDEKTLNPFLTKFIRENYKNATSMKAVRASIAGRRMRVECVVKFKSGSTKKTTLTFENFIPTMKVRTISAKADSAFKIESRKAVPFKFEAYTKNNVIRFTGMKYDFITKKEGKRVQVYGKYVMNEGKMSFRRGNKKVRFGSCSANLKESFKFEVSEDEGELPDGSPELYLVVNDEISISIMNGEYINEDGIIILINNDEEGESYFSYDFYFDTTKDAKDKALQLAKEISSDGFDAVVDKYDMGPVNY